MTVSFAQPSNKIYASLGLIRYELYSLLSTSHLMGYISVHTRFDLERFVNYPSSYHLVDFRVERKHKKRAVTRVPLQLSDGLQLGVSV